MLPSNNRMKLAGRGQRLVLGLAPPAGFPHTGVQRAAALQLMRGVRRFNEKFHATLELEPLGIDDYIVPRPP